MRHYETPRRNFAVANDTSGVRSSRESGTVDSNVVLLTRRHVVGEYLLNRLPQCIDHVYANVLRFAQGDDKGSVCRKRIWKYQWRPCWKRCGFRDCGRRLGS